MSISFDKNREKIITAWKDVLCDKSSTNWSLFGYEGQTNELKVVGSGEGGIDELCEELNCGKIMYAFVRIKDPKTGLKKFILVNWQGEGAPVLRKGTCANHIHDVAKILAGSHLTINARNEDDMDTERLIKKLSTVSSGYCFKEPRTVHEELKTPVGTNYARVVPGKELNPSVMQDFWKKEEEEEKRRLEAEKELKRQELLILEKETRAREEKEHLEREKKISGNSKLQPAHVPIKTSPQPLSPEKTSANCLYGMTEAERMRQMRNQEARDLIGSRVGAAKAIFTQNTSEGQLQNKLVSAPPAKPARASIAQRINAFNNQNDQQQQQQQPPPPVSVSTKTSILQEENIKSATTAAAVVAAATIPQPTMPQHIRDVEPPVKPEMTAIANNDDVHPTEDYIENEEQFSTIKRSPHSKSNSLQSPDESNSLVATTTQQQQQRNNKANKVEQQQQQQQQQRQESINGLPEQNDASDIVNEDDFICQDSLNDLGLKARALYDYEAADESEITFDPGDVITHIDQIDEGWWQGLAPDGTYGLFPANYVELIN